MHMIKRRIEISDRGNYLVNSAFEEKSLPKLVPNTSSCVNMAYKTGFHKHATSLILRKAWFHIGSNITFMNRTSNSVRPIMFLQIWVWSLISSFTYRSVCMLTALNLTSILSPYRAKICGEEHVEHAYKLFRSRTQALSQAVVLCLPLFQRRAKHVRNGRLRHSACLTPLPRISSWHIFDCIHHQSYKGSRENKRRLLATVTDSLVPQSKNNGAQSVSTAWVALDSRRWLSQAPPSAASFCFSKGKLTKLKRWGRKHCSS